MKEKISQFRASNKDINCIVIFPLSKLLNEFGSEEMAKESLLPYVYGRDYFITDDLSTSFEVTESWYLGEGIYETKHRTYTKVREDT